jgi:DNA-binding response OmpR family regulator
MNNDLIREIKQLQAEISINLEKQKELKELSDSTLLVLKNLLSKINSQIVSFNRKYNQIESIMENSELSDVLEQALKAEEIQIGSFKLSIRTRMLTRNDISIKLTNIEIKLLVFLSVNKNENVSRNDIITVVWGEEDYYRTRSIDIYVCKLRKYLKEDATIHLINLRGSGYRFIY